IALQCGAGYNAYASARGDYGGQIQFQAPNSGDWIVKAQADEFFQIVPTGDGWFSLYSTTYGAYVWINLVPDELAENCLPLKLGSPGPVNVTAQAARFA